MNKYKLKSNTKEFSIKKNITTKQQTTYISHTTFYKCSFEN